MVLSLQTVNRIDELVARVQAEGRAPSIVAAVIRDGSIVHVAGAGDRPAPDRETQYRIGSISKSFTAAVILGLRDDGHLRLDDAIGDHLGGLPQTIGRLRLRELLGMAGGLQREPDGEWWERSAVGPLPELLAALHEGKLAAKPFDRFHYSNLGYGLLGGIITEVTGQTWFDAVTHRILRPLGMHRTTYHPEEPFARGYVIHPWYATLREEPRLDSGAMAAAGQLWSTAADLSRWAAVLAASAPPAAPQPLTIAGLPGESTIAEMACPVVISDPDGWTSGYGLGLQLFRRGERIFVGHTGSMPGYLAVLVVHRPSRTGVVAFANTYNLAGHAIGALGMSLVEAVLECEPQLPPNAWRPATTPPPAVEPLCGRWWWMGHEYLVRYADNHLVIVPPRVGVAPWVFEPESADVWRGVRGDQIGELLRVRRNPDGAVEALDLATYILARDPG